MALRVNLALRSFACLSRCATNPCRRALRRCEKNVVALFLFCLKDLSEHCSELFSAASVWTLAFSSEPLGVHFSPGGERGPSRMPRELLPLLGSTLTFFFSWISMPSREATKPVLRPHTSHQSCPGDMFRSPELNCALFRHVVLGSSGEEEEEEEEEEL